MQELIKININSEDITVSGRELHEALGVKTAYKDWFPRMTEYGFEEGKDFCSKMSESTGGRPSSDHEIKLDMAKEIAMIQRNEKGKQARKYFIEIEKEWNSPEKVMARALIMANKKIDNLKLENEEIKATIETQKPKVIFADAVATSNTSILVGDLAKILKQNGHEIGGVRLFKWLRNNGYLIKRKGTDYNMPTQKSMELGLFEIKETSVVHSDGHTSINKTPKVTGKGQQYFINKLL